MYHCLKLVRPQRFGLSLCKAYATSANEEVAAVPRLQISTALRQDVPVEKLSLSRGLMLDKFEKDFFIFPEHQDTDDVRNIDGYVKILHDSLKAAINSGDMERSGGLSESARLAIDRNSLFAALVPAEFDGLAMTNKDKARICEELSVDWSLASSINVVNTVVSLLIIYGSEKQKAKYLPLIASGKCRPGCVIVEKGMESTLPELFGVGHQQLLEGTVKLNNCSSANLVLLLAKSAGAEKSISCYIIDRTELDNDSKWEVEREPTLGLKAFEIGKLKIRTVLTDHHLLGEFGKGEDIANELESCGRIPFAAEATGFAKRVIDDLSTFSNQTMLGNTANAVLADSASVQRIITELATKVYALESATYYLSGLLDEKLPVVLDMENALLHRQTVDVLRGCLSAVIEIRGLQSSQPGHCYERWIRDVSTLLTLNSAGDSTEKIAMCALSTWAVTKYAHAKSSLQRIFKMASNANDLQNPKLKHYIAEHAHPSLQHACQELEFSMTRTNAVLDKLMAEQGKHLESDYGSMERIVKVLQNNLMMVTVISRASRSYSIGLRNSDIEVFFATHLCSRLSKSTWFELEALRNHFDLVRLNPSFLDAGRAILQMGGYKIENPLEKNW